MQITNADVGLDFACVICTETNDDKNHIEKLSRHLMAYESDLRAILDTKTFQTYTEKIKTYKLMNNSNFQRCIKVCIHKYFNYIV